MSVSSKSPSASNSSTLTRTKKGDSVSKLSNSVVTATKDVSEQEVLITAEINLSSSEQLATQSPEQRITSAVTSVDNAQALEICSAVSNMGAVESSTTVNSPYAEADGVCKSLIEQENSLKNDSSKLIHASEEFFTPLTSAGSKELSRESFETGKVQTAVVCVIPSSIDVEIDIDGCLYLSRESETFSG